VWSRGQVNQSQQSTGKVRMEHLQCVFQ